ncbi:hypothetical protein GCM10010284_21420 [Streptomyces rubiginosohelvolus]|uniref:Uncharacterized protein n=1 Tax=Streptomyces rubiginosohelvolus TaxID=67362 RepID=A0ABQ3BGD2_9ACTN|nr:hypothetical protein GCM10010284_21420 [Streptomyces rubiginosohelvolus]GGZ42413.1 hypothetical protein GCM10010328_15390 [Streptomyces pluricolorescens]
MAGWLRGRIPGAQPQHPPPQQPPPPPEGAGADPAAPPTATADNSLTVSSWPAGQEAGSEDCAMGRLTSKVSPQVRHRNSYRGMGSG